MLDWTTFILAKSAAVVKVKLHHHPKHCDLAYICILRQHRTLQHYAEEPDATGARATYDDAGRRLHPHCRTQPYACVDRLHIHLARMGVLEDATPAATPATPSAPAAAAQAATAPAAVPPAPAPPPQFVQAATVPAAIKPVPAALPQQSRQSLSLALLSPTASDLSRLVLEQPALVPPPADVTGTARCCTLPRSPA
ncbi:hypothetical protein Efla_003365 [Eimeria flavescens]